MMAFSACRNRSYSVNDLPPDYIVFGSGGGFANQLESNYLLPNGQILRTRSIGDVPAQVPALKGKAVRNIYRALEQSGFRELELNAPDNMYSFIAYVEHDEELHRITWGFDAEVLPTKVREVQKMLWDAISESP